MILCIGLNYWQSRLVLAAKRRGHRVAGVDIDPNAHGCGECDIYLQASAHDPNGILAGMEKAGIRPDMIDAVLTLGTRGALTTVAQICERLGVPGAVLPMEGSGIVVDRARFRAFVQALDLPTPRHAIIHSVDAVAPFAGPWVVKASKDTSGSEGLTVVHQASDLPSAIRRALRAARRHGDRGAAIIEQYVPGKDIGIFAIFQSGTPVFSTIIDRTVTALPYCLPQRYAIPTNVSESAETAALRCFGTLAAALRIGSGPFYAEVRVEAETGRPFVIEAEPTLPAFISTVVSMAHRIDLEDLFLHVATKTTTIDLPGEHRAAVCRFLYGPAGTVASMSCPATHRVDVIGSALRQAGDRLDPTTCASICAYAVAAGSDVSACDTKASQHLHGFAIRMAEDNAPTQDAR